MHKSCTDVILKFSGIRKVGKILILYLLVARKKIFNFSENEDEKGDFPNLNVFIYRFESMI